MKRCVSIAAGLIAACLTAAGQSHYVSHWGSHSPPFSSWETAATNIADAIAAAPNGATVWVTNGVYRTGSTSTNGLLTRASVTRGLTLRSVNGYRDTVIEGAFHSATNTTGANAVRSLYMTSGIVDGFTLRGGSTAATGSDAATAGGGVYAAGGTLRNMRITGNHGYTAAGAWLQTCTVSNTVVAANASTTGPRVKINRHVNLNHVSLNEDGMMLPDIRILGTNATAITNGAFETSVDQGNEFGQVHAVTGTATHVFTITNMGVRALIVDRVSPQGGHTSDWTVADWPTNALAPGEAAPLEIAFAPQGPGQRRSLLFVANNDPDDDPYAIWLSGEGIQAEMLVLATNDWSTITNGSAQPLLVLGTDFGDVRITGDPKANSYVVTNSGTALLQISQVLTTELQADDFTVTAPTNFPLDLAVGATSLASVTFAPLALGYRATLLRLESDAVNSPYVFGIMGRGVEPEMRVTGKDSSRILNGDNTPTPADGTDFGMFTGAPLTQSFSITNAGTYALTLTGTPHLVISGAHAADFTLDAQPASPIASGATVDFDITFYPSMNTTRTATVSIYSDDVYFTNAIYQFSIQADCDPDTRFANILATIAPASAAAVKWADFNNDDLADLIVAGYDGTNRATRIYRNLGSGNFTLQATSIPGVDSARIAVGDFDNDGLVDIALSGMRSSGPLTAIYRNNGDWTFTDIEAGLTAAYTGDLAWGDFDNDGDLDLFVSGYTLSSSISTLYRNNGDQTFTATEEIFVASRDSSAIWIDVDNNGWLDLLITGSSTSGRIANLYRNTAGSFALVANDGITEVSHGGIATADFNADGRSDILINGYSSTGMTSDIYRYGSSPDGALFTRQSNTFTPLWLGSVVAGDLDNNGWADVIIAGEAAGGIRTAEMHFNTSGSFARIASLLNGIRTSGMALGDYDNDGDLDLAMAGLATNGAISGIYRNLGTVPNTPPTAPAGLTAVLTNGNEVILSWQPASDAESPTNALTYNLYLGSAMAPGAIMSPHADVTTGKRRVFESGNAGQRTQWHVRNLTPGDMLEWGVQTIDSAYLGGEFTAGVPFEVPAIPDFVVSDIRIQRTPFSATVTVMNQGTDTGNAGTLAVWLNKPEAARPSDTADATRTVGELAAGASSNVVFTTFNFPTNTVTNVFRAFINSNDAQIENTTDNNQRTLTYIYTIYPPFWFSAVALTDSVYLRWPDPLTIGTESSEARVHYATNSYPATTSDGTLIYQGTNQLYKHTGLIQTQPYFYTIWLTHDGTNWFAPPE